MISTENIVSKIDNRVFILLLAIQMAFLYSIYKGFTDPFAVLILIAIASSVAFIMTINFEIASYLFIISFIFDQDLTTGMRVRVADLIAALLVFSFFLKVV